MRMRPYQKEAVTNTLEAFKTHTSVLNVLPTGAGKTIIMSHVAKTMMPQGRILLVAHREELIYQGRDKMETVTGMRGDIEMGENFAHRGYFKSDIVVATVQTLNAGRDGGRITDFKPDEFSLVMIDEAHRSVAPSYLNVIRYFKQNPKVKFLGVTATPDRADDKALGKIYEKVAFEYKIQKGISDGWLVPVFQQPVYVHGLDFSAIKTTVGENGKDLNGKELAAVMEYEENLHMVAHPTVELTGDKKTLVFAASVAHAERLTEIINRHKQKSARFVCGATPKETRRKTLSDYADREFQYLVNVGCFTEGFDDPDVEVIVMARPTKSRSLYSQMLGRGLRPCGSIAYPLNDCEDAVIRREMILQSPKPSCTVIDFVGNSGKHKLVHAADVLGGDYSDAIVKRAKKNAEKAGKPLDVMGELAKAEQEIAKERSRRDEAEIRAKLLVKAEYTTSTINPFDTQDRECQRTQWWHKYKPATHKQIAVLEKNGIDTDGLTIAQASEMLDKLIGSRKKCSEKQANFLKKRGIDPADVSFKQAVALITAFKNCGWKKPPNLNELLAAKG